MERGNVGRGLQARRGPSIPCCITHFIILCVLFSYSASSLTHRPNTKLNFNYLTQFDPVRMGIFAIWSVPFQESMKQPTSSTYPITVFFLLFLFIGHFHWINTEIKEHEIASNCHQRHRRHIATQLLTCVRQALAKYNINRNQHQTNIEKH